MLLEKSLWCWQRGCQRRRCISESNRPILIVEPGIKRGGPYVLRVQRGWWKTGQFVKVNRSSWKPKNGLYGQLSVRSWKIDSFGFWVYGQLIVHWQLRDIINIILINNNNINIIIINIIWYSITVQFCIRSRTNLDTSSSYIKLQIQYHFLFKIIYYSYIM